MATFIFSIQPNFAAPPVTAQPTVKPFVPAPPPVLKNADQYQQPTLGSQLYPVCLLSMFISHSFSFWVAESDCLIRTYRQWIFL